MRSTLTLWHNCTKSFVNFILISSEATDSLVSPFRSLVRLPTGRKQLHHSKYYLSNVPHFPDAMLFEIIYLIAMVGVVFCNGMVLVSQYQLRRNSKTSVNGYVASLSISAIIFACFFAPTVFTAHFQTLSPPFVCYAVPSIQLLCVSSTAFCLVMVAVDLYVMVVRASGPAQLHGGLPATQRPSFTVVSLSLKHSASRWSPCHLKTQLHGGLLSLKHPASRWSPCHLKTQLHGGLPVT